MGHAAAVDIQDHFRKVLEYHLSEERRAKVPTPVPALR